jgi:beta-lactamase superfamily II metal-dependent hydrolase
MHHGARANWHQGIANAIAPYFSVFSSDPEHRRYKHPHAEVVRDFWQFGAIQVDKASDFNVYGYLEKQ